MGGMTLGDVKIGSLLDQTVKVEWQDGLKLVVNLFKYCSLIVFIAYELIIISAIYLVPKVSKKFESEKYVISDFSSTESEDEDDVPIWKNGSEKTKSEIKLSSSNILDSTPATQSV